MENSKLEDLDDFLDNIQKHHGKGMKAQSADPDLLTFGRSESLHSPSCKCKNLYYWLLIAIVCLYDTVFI